MQISIIEPTGWTQQLDFDSSGAALAWLIQSGFTAEEYGTWTNEDTQQEAIV